MALLGPHKPRRLDEPNAVSLEDLVPANHVYRHFAATLDPGFVRDWAQERYADRGRPSSDPATFFTLPLIMFEVRRYHTTEAYKKAIRNRQVWVGPLLAEPKEWHGLRRLRLRRLLNAIIQGLLIAAGQNPRRFLAVTGWDRRHAACGNLVALPLEPWRLGTVFDRFPLA